MSDLNMSQEELSIKKLENLIKNNENKKQYIKNKLIELHKLNSVYDEINNNIFFDNKFLKLFMDNFKIINYLVKNNKYDDDNHILLENKNPNLKQTDLIHNSENLKYNIEELEYLGSSIDEFAHEHFYKINNNYCIKVFEIDDHYDFNHPEWIGYYQVYDLKYKFLTKEEYLKNNLEKDLTHKINLNNTFNSKI